MEKMLQRLGAFTPPGRQEISRRIDGLKEVMVKRGINFAIIMQNVDMFYFTGTLQKGMLAVAPDHDPLLFIEKSVTRAKLDTPLEIIPIKNNREAKATLVSKNILQGRGGMELDVVPVTVFERFKSVMGCDNFVDISPLIRELRMLKSPYELAQIRKSGAIFSHVYNRAKEVIREGVSEVAIQALLVAEGRIRGHQGFPRIRGFNQEMMPMCVFAGYSSGIPSFWDGPIAGLGVTPAMPQGPSLLPVQRGIPVIIDYGSGYNGYVTDETRVFVAGEMREIFRKPYEVAREILEDAAEFGKAGVNSTELYERACRMVKKAGLEEHFMGHGEGQVSFVGHGLGLEMNELPVITARHRRTLEAGMVFACEPKFVFPGIGAVGLEVSFIVGNGCLERISDVPLDLVNVPAAKRCIDRPDGAAGDMPMLPVPSA